MQENSKLTKALEEALTKEYIAFADNAKTANSKKIVEFSEKNKQRFKNIPYHTKVFPALAGIILVLVLLFSIFSVNASFNYIGDFSVLSDGKNTTIRSKDILFPENADGLIYAITYRLDDFFFEANKNNKGGVYTSEKNGTHRSVSFSYFANEFKYTFLEQEDIPSAMATDINGHTAVFIPNNSLDDSYIFIWFDGNVIISVECYGFSQDDAIKIARSVKQI
ncbi:MAG: DUF4367 domain-containing protein [Clostridiales bacterium]|nr:DUF4367 domain-containing protein [Clostridiales bacterium]